jgi:thermitase
MVHALRSRCAVRKLRPQVEPMEPRALLNVGPGSRLAASGAAVSPVPDASSADRLLVRFRPGTTAVEKNSILAATGTTVESVYPDGPSLVETGPGIDPSQALQKFEASPLVAYAEFDSRLALSSIIPGLPSDTPFYPNNPLFLQEWGLNNQNDMDIDGPEAWSVTTGHRSTIIAVLDTGVDLHNPNLVSRLWVNPETSSPRHPAYGWNFVSNNKNVQDDNGHGTHVTGIIAAPGNNGQGVAGVDWHAQIMPLKILGADGSGSLDAAVSAVYYAADHGARVINASWGTSQPDPALADAISYADKKGVVFVTAAGNDSANNDLVPTYPASYHESNMLVAAAVDAGGGLASFSNYGAQTVHIAAPGVNILSTYPGGSGYAWLSGTSMATPYVTGVVSLVAGMHPDWTAEQLVQQVLTTTKPLPSLAGKTLSGGIVDAAQAVGVAGSGPNGDHYVYVPLVAASRTTGHSAPLPHPPSRANHRSPHSPIRRHSANSPQGFFRPGSASGRDRFPSRTVAI